MLNLAVTLTSLIDDALKFQKSKVGLQQKAAFSPKGFIHEFGTIRLGTRRRAGHSTAIKYCMEMFPTSAVIVPYAASASIFVEMGVPAKRVFLKDEVPRGAMRGKRHNIVFVDNAFYFSRSYLQKVQEDLSAHYDCGPVLLVLVQ
jgi:hypothetical protein